MIDSLRVATSDVDAGLKLHRVGEAGFLNLLTAQRSYSQTNLAYLDALRHLRTASAEIEGMLLSNSMQASGP